MVHTNYKFPNTTSSNTLGTLNYQNTAEDKIAIHLKLYIFIPIPPHPHQGETILTTFKSITLPIETTLIMNALIILDGSWGWDLI